MPCQGRQLRHPPTPAFRRERARRSPSHALLLRTTSRRLARRRPCCCNRRVRNSCGGMRRCRYTHPGRCMRERAKRPDFALARETQKRRGRDSNPRDRFRPAGFQEEGRGGGLWLWVWGLRRCHGAWASQWASPAARRPVQRLRWCERPRGRRAVRPAAIFRCGQRDSATTPWRPGRGLAPRRTSRYACGSLTR
jgi:hypothetical protein